MGKRKKRREGDPRRADLRSIVDSVIRSDARPTLESEVVQLVLEKYPNLAPWRSDLFDLARSLLAFT